MKHFIFHLCSIATLLAPAFGGDVASEIYGTWKLVESRLDTQKLNFQETTQKYNGDGSLLIVLGGMPSNGRFEFISAKRMRFTYDALPDREFETTVEIVGDKMIQRDAAGGVTTFVRSTENNAAATASTSKISGDKTEEAVFDGDWRGSVRTPGGEEFRIRLVIDGNKGTQYLREADGWQPHAPEKTMIHQLRDICVFAWLSQGKVWTEHQVFSLSYVTSSKVSLVWMRHVTNRKEGKPGEAWNERGEGELTRMD